MADDNDELEGQDGDDGAKPPTPAAATRITAADVRKTPEYREQRRVAKTARDAAAAAQAEAEEARAEVERLRSEGETAAAQALDSQIRSTLSDDQITAYNELQTLSASDPVAAARRFAELLASGQTPPAAGDQTGQESTDGGATVTGQQTQLGQGADHLEGAAPLGGASSNATDWDSIATAEEAKYAAIVERNRNGNTRNRVTMKERAEGFMSYIASGYAKAVGKRERDARG